MRVAILHDYLNQLGGAEVVLEAFLELFPEADVYTLLYDKNKTESIFEGRIIKTSFLDLPFVRNHHRPFIPLLPLAAKTIKSTKHYDLVISSTTGYSKGFNIRGTHHIAYCHTILPYAWEDEYLKTLPFVPKLFYPLAQILAGFLRSFDRKTVKNVDTFLANSKFISQKIKRFYDRDSIVIYPPVDEDKFYYEKTKPSEEYYLMAGRLVYYKRFDLGVEAFKKLEKKLKIVGDGFAASKLKNSADSKYIEFLPYLPQEKLRELFLNARALIFPQVEHFGLIAAEAQLCGLPVIAYRDGGALEIIEEGKTGLFFDEQTPGAIINAVQDFEHLKLNRKYISQVAERFLKENFKDKIKSIVNQTCLR